MPYFNSQHDAISIFYQVYTPETYDLTLIFSHGWPMSSRMFEHMVLPLVDKYRCIVYDRRGFGKSDWGSTNWNVFVDDFAQMIRLTCSTPFIGVGSSMGCNELLSVLGKDDIAALCKGLVWLAPALPAPIASEVIPLAPSQDIYDSLLVGFRKDRYGFIRGALPGIFARDLTPTELARFETIVDQADSVAFEQCIKILIKTDFIAQLEKLDKPTLVVWGKLDANIPIEAGAYAIKDLANHVEVRVYEDAGHGMYLTHAEQCLTDLENFIKSIQT